jgi:alpha-tubulin suppressor-like RCC1 family protein
MRGQGRRHGGVLGDGANGRLGGGDSQNTSTPKAVSKLVGIAEIATGLYHSCAVLKSGKAACWGNNEWGQLGNGLIASTSAVPTVVVGLDDIETIATTAVATCALHKSHTVSCWGRNAFGELADPLDPSSHLTSLRIPDFGDVTAISAGDSTFCGLKTNGDVYCWGYNATGQIGEGLGGPAEGISVGNRHACAVVGGEAFCWGLNSSGQVGDGTTVSSPIPSKVVGLKNVIQVATGEVHTCARVVGGRDLLLGRKCGRRTR